MTRSMTEETLYELVDLVDNFMSCADWYRRNLEDVVDRRPVRGLDEAQEGYHHAKIKLTEMLGKIDPEPDDRRHASAITREQP